MTFTGAMIVIVFFLMNAEIIYVIAIVEEVTR